jgi:hypothetical protein
MNGFDDTDAAALEKFIRGGLALAAILGVAALVAVAGHILAGCASPHKGPPPVPTAQRGTASCSSACSNLERLGCPEARPTTRALTCVTICERASAIQDMRLACVSAAPSFTALRACETVRCTE